MKSLATLSETLRQLKRRNFPVINGWCLGQIVLVTSPLAAGALAIAQRPVTGTFIHK